MYLASISIAFFDLMGVLKHPEHPSGYTLVERMREHAQTLPSEETSEARAARQESMSEHAQLTHNMY